MIKSSILLARLAVIAGLLILGACSDSGDQDGGKPAQAGPDTPIESVENLQFRLLDRFDIGENIYARSLLARDDTLWVGTSAGLMDISLDEYLPRKIYTRDDGLANEYVFSVGSERNGNIWLGTNGGGASRLRNGKMKTFFPTHGLADYWVYAFAQQRNGDLWIGTWAGANRMDTRKETFETFFDELINEWVYGIAVDSQDRVWFGTEGGMTMFDGKNWKHWTHAQGLGSDNFKSLPHSDNTGLGTRKRHNLNVMVGTGESYNPNYVFSVAVDRKDHVWAGTWGAGVSRFDGENWVSYSSEDGLPGNIVYSMMIDGDGHYWFGTNRGLVIFDGENWKPLGLAIGIQETDVYAISQDRNGHVWIGLKGAVVRIEKSVKEG